jgi:rRNA maturation protein Nop10
MESMQIKRCPVCLKYTLKDACCGKETASASPPKFSPEDKYWRQRLKAKGIM